ncbi:MAG: YcxB family protein [Cytophagales bacterium]|nr:YcxB family protein [Cytophagales bacterium]
MMHEFVISEKDYIKFNIYHQWGAPEQRYKRIGFPILLTLIFLLSFIDKEFEKTNIMDYTMPIACVVIAFVFLPFLVKSGIRLGVKKRLMREENQGFIGKRTIEIGENSFKIITKYTDTTFKWKSINRIAENKDQFLIYVSETSTYIIPIASFENMEEYEKFKKLVFSHYEKSH